MAGSRLQVTLLIPRTYTHVETRRLFERSPRNTFVAKSIQAGAWVTFWRNISISFFFSAFARKTDFCGSASIIWKLNLRHWRIDSLKDRYVRWSFLNWRQHSSRNTFLKQKTSRIYFHVSGEPCPGSWKLHQHCPRAEQVARHELWCSPQVGRRLWDYQVRGEKIFSLSLFVTNQLHLN